MVKIRINILYEFFVLVEAIEGVTLTLCEHSVPGYKSVTCQGDEVIKLKKIIYSEFPCQTASNSHICHSNITTYVNENCLGQNNCTLQTDILSEDSCQRAPRHLVVNFDCSRNGWFGKYPVTVHTCSNSLAEVTCPSGYHIHIKSVKSYDDQIGCDRMDTGCAKRNLKSLCNEKRRCSPDATKVLCLFHERFASISSVCSDHEFNTTTIPVASVTSEHDKLSVLSLDDDHRVEIYEHALNRNLYLCSSGWDDFGASVLCKSFNRTWIGNATIVDKLSNITIAPFSLQCGGLESSLFSCNYTENENDCNTTKVAGAICWEGTNKLSKAKPGTRTSTLVVAVGVSVGFIGMVSIIIVVVFIRRRYIRENSDRKFSNFMSNTTDDNYLGQQDIALPQYPTNNKVLYSQVPNSNTDMTKKEDSQEYSYPSKDTESPYALSEEGVYDKTNERRHVVKDTDVYSRTVDTVYDSSEQHMRQERKEETYDHVFGQKTEDIYDQTTRT
ncbi:unnamed protein product [Mytilus coruscus]|uniref:SRCR domain-containing protein n=1 Tax=Mytilus coruscus TaxID=42192 RepID=A0A6J8CQT3_MYTCO|nr:unnamed protein product [Mytilus coruscus]